MRANLVGSSVVSAITQTPASGPAGPVTTPPMSSPSMRTAPLPACWAPSVTTEPVQARAIATATTSRYRPCFLVMAPLLLPGQDRGLVLLDPLLDRHQRLDAVELAGVLAHQLSLRLGGYADLRHMVQSLPGVFGVVVGVVRRPDGDVLEDVPQPIDQGLVRLESDIAALVEDLDRIADEPVVTLEREQVREVRAARQDQRQPRRVRFEHRGLELRELLEPSRLHDHRDPRHCFH